MNGNPQVYVLLSVLFVLIISFVLFTGSIFAHPSPNESVGVIIANSLARSDNASVAGSSKELYFEEPTIKLLSIENATDASQERLVFVEVIQLNKARIKRQPAILFFGGRTDFQKKTEVALRKVILGGKEQLPELDSFVRLYFTENLLDEKVLEHFSVRMLPLILLLDSRGVPVASFSNPRMSVETWQKELKRIIERCDRIRRDEGRQSKEKEKLPVTETKADKEQSENSSQGAPLPGRPAPANPVGTSGDK
jgi:hypothetical protein